MHSWVRYSVSVYLGLLIAGSIASPTPAVSVGAAPELSPEAALEITSDIGLRADPPIDASWAQQPTEAGEPARACSWCEWAR